MLKQFTITKVLFLVFLGLNIQSACAQYDSTHYIPPFYSRSTDAQNLGEHYLFLSTNSTTPFDVTVTEADGTPIAVVNISMTNEAQINLGTQFAAVGIVDQTQLNTPISNEGIIATASTPFFANIRHSAGSQGASLTSKGTWAQGTRFRSGHLFTQLSAGLSDGPLKVHIISVMAMEDSTTVTFSDIKPGVIFNGTPVTGNTSDDITITLNQYESYIIAAHLDEPLATGNDTLVNGVLIESDLPIVVNTGSWCGGSNVTQASSSRDIGLDQIVPTNLLGEEHIVVKRFAFLEHENERVIVVADEDSTEIFINGSGTPIAILNAGEFYILPATEYDLNDIMYIVSSKNIYIYQSTNGSASVPYAQGLNFIPPLACSGIKEVTIPTIDSFDGIPAGIDIISKVGSTVLMDGGPLGVAPLPVTGNPDWEVYKLSNMVGTVNFAGTDNMNVALIANSGARGAAGYFSGFSQFQAEIEAQSSTGDSIIIEGCSVGEFILTKPEDQLNSDVVFYFIIEGTAINGVDYTLIPDSISIPAGTIEDTLFIDPIFDGEFESFEYVILTIINNTPCDTLVIVDTLWIKDYFMPAITEIAEDQLICAASGEYAELFATATLGEPPYIYDWSPYGGSDSVAQVSPLVTTSYTVSVTDNCGNWITSDSMLVHNYCLPAAPNIITVNGDQINDLFIIKNLEQYPDSKLVIINRWGEVVYQNDNYDNSWDGDNLVDGVYFYKLEINYNPDLGITYFEDGNTMSGFVYLVRD